MKKAVFQVAGPAVLLQRDDIDTDALFPAEFLKVTTRTGMGRYLFADWIKARNPEADFVAQGRKVRVLVAPRNFGCGSSREHAVWALADFGIEAILALSYGDIFRNNCVKNDVVAATVTPEVHAAIVAALAGGTDAVLHLDVAAATLGLPDGRSVPIALAPGHAEQLLSDEDDIARTLRLDAALQSHEQRIAAQAPWLLAPAP
jgi:3-isopropylmalate/(R)-2-methylmalate dehydratase small subunit